MVNTISDYAQMIYNLLEVVYIMPQTGIQAMHKELTVHLFFDKCL